MSLTQTPTGFTAKTSSVSKIIIVAPNTTIQAVSYGTDAAGVPIAVHVDPGNKSFSITILPGEETLQVNLVSPGPGKDVVTIKEQLAPTPKILTIYTMNGTTGAWTPRITGTP